MGTRTMEVITILGLTVGYILGIIHVSDNLISATRVQHMVNGIHSLAINQHSFMCLIIHINVARQCSFFYQITVCG